MSINQQVAAQLWDSLTVTVERFKSVVRIHEKSHFLGFADVKIDATAKVPGLILQLRGIEVKLLKGEQRIDMPTEKGSDGVFYPRFFPQSAELRAVLTTAIFRTDAVKAAVADAAAKATAAGTPTSAPSASNPFSA